MSRLLFEKTGNAVWISHLDLMRVMQRSFRRAGYFLKHTGGFNQHAYVALALPLSVGTSSSCEILDFDLDDPYDPSKLTEDLNRAFPEGVHALKAYENGDKFGKLCLLHARLTLEYDNGNAESMASELRKLFASEHLNIEKNGKNGPVTVDIRPMILSLNINAEGENVVILDAVVTAQNPSLNPMLMATAIERYAPACRPDYCSCHRIEVMKEDGTAFR